MTTVVISSSQFLESFEFISRLAGNLEDKLTLRTLVVDRLIVFDLGRDFRQKKCIELFLRKAHDIKIEINVLKFTELDAKKLFVPPGVECQLIVGNAQCFLLRVGEPLQADRRHFLHADRLRGQCSTVACNELIVFIDQDRVCKTELLDRFRDLLY